MNCDLHPWPVEVLADVTDCCSLINAFSQCLLSTADVCPDQPVWAMVVINASFLFQAIPIFLFVTYVVIQVQHVVKWPMIMF